MCLGAQIFPLKDKPLDFTGGEDTLSFASFLGHLRENLVHYDVKVNVAETNGVEATA